MYTTKNFRAKKHLLAAVANGEKLTIYSPGMFPAPKNGKVDLEGPHFPKPHTWYAQAIMVDGFITEVR